MSTTTINPEYLKTEYMGGQGVPEHLHQGLVNWVVDHIRPGAFLAAVLEDKFVDAVLRADDVCRESLRDIALYIANHFPFECWGSVERVQQWASQRLSGG